MAKRSKKAKKARPGMETQAEGRSGSATPDLDSEPGVAGDVTDPLAHEAWANESASPEEAEERARFDQAWEAFRRGDFRRCRVEATRLAADATSAEVRRRARALVDRLRVDPLALGMAAVALALLLMAVIWTFA